MATASVKSTAGFWVGNIAPSAFAKIKRLLPNVLVEYDADDRSVRFPSRLLRNVTWDAYEAIVDSIEHGRFRHAYVEGTLEMMSPLIEHEWAHAFIARCLEALALELDIPIIAAASTTQRKKRIRRGAEPDNSYYIQNEAVMRGRLKYDPNRDPPPDLVIEADMTRSSDPRLPVYARLGVPEVWQYKRRTLVFLHRTSSGQYRPSHRSRAFPFLTPDDFTAVIAQHGEQSDNALIKQFVSSVRAKLRDAAIDEIKRSEKE